MHSCFLELTMIHILHISFIQVFPIFLLIMLGYPVRRLHLVDDNFIAQANRVVYFVCLPLLLFYLIATCDLYAFYKGVAKALELTLSVRVFLPRDEQDTGLFNYVLPAENVLPKAMELAREIAENTSATSVALTKGMLWHGLSEPDPQAAHLIDSRIFYWAGRQADAKEGIESFLEKRPARFTLSPTRDKPEIYPWWRETQIQHLN
jgi:hypothetical protein